MTVETLQDSLDWSQQLHERLAQSLLHCSQQTDDQRLKWLLDYLVEHEQSLAKNLARFREQADPKALHTWIYDYIAHMDIHPANKFAGMPEPSMDFDAICDGVFDAHNRIISLFRYLGRHADIPEAETLVENLLGLEEHETMLIAQQINRLRDM